MNRYWFGWKFRHSSHEGRGLIHATRDAMGYEHGRPAARDPILDGAIPGLEDLCRLSRESSASVSHVLAEPQSHQNRQCERDAENHVQNDPQGAPGLAALAAAAEPSRPPRGGYAGLQAS